MDIPVPYRIFLIWDSRKKGFISISDAKADSSNRVDWETFVSNLSFTSAGFVFDIDTSFWIKSNSLVVFKKKKWMESLPFSDKNTDEQLNCL